ncbi:hypothetical protein QP938_02345 [Porticoccaceae bacterium LTM1]|nr:hypothetical protein QP938_02345 [Porticoccaceae bacterium LTM1]
MTRKTGTKKWSLISLVGVFSLALAFGSFAEDPKPTPEKDKTEKLPEKEKPEKVEQEKTEAEGEQQKAPPPPKKKEDIFKPTEEISEDLSVPFPIDI